MLGELRPVDGGLPILLEKPSITVGQDRTCDVVIEHPSVSANHCLMEFRDGHWFIEDLGSRGGIGVNGEKVERAWVPALSVINIGTIEFDLQYSGSRASTDERAAVSAELLSKLDRAIKSVPRQKSRRIQVRAGQSDPAEFDRTPLAFLQPTNGGQPIPLLYDELYLGRDPDGDVVLPYMAIAKTHCVLRFQDGYWLVRDLNNNGVTVNGEAVSEGWLLPGTVLGLATQLFTLNYTTSAIEPPPEMAVPINEFAVRDSDSAERTAAPHAEVEIDVDAADVEVEHWDVDESALIDDEPESDHVPSAKSDPQCSIAEPPPIPPRSTDEPLHSVEEMLLAIEEPAPTPPKTIAPSRARRKRRPRADQTLATPERRADDRSIAPEAPSAPTTSLVVTRQQLSVVQRKQERIAQLLQTRGCHSLLLTRPANIAWYTGGAEMPRRFDGEPAAALLMTAEGGSLLSRRADGDELLKRVSSDIVLQRRDGAWPSAARELLAEHIGSSQLASDQPFECCTDAASDVAGLRLPLLPSEVERLRKLGIRVARTVERAAREFSRGDTESQIAGDVASRLIRHEVVPVQIQVWGDDRGSGCQNWSHGREAVHHECTISVTARRYGLHVAVSRTVSFGIPSKERRWSFLDMLLAHGTALASSRDQREVSAVWGDVQCVCESLGEVEAWHATDPGCITGYELCEAPVSAANHLPLRAGMPVLWRTMIGTARAVDTVLVREADCKVLTQTGEWPQTSVTVNGQPFFVHTMLHRTV